MTLLPALTFGFVLGLRHATDADHVAAVGTLAVTRGALWRAVAVGAWWGAGHSMSVVLVGGALIALRTPMPSRVALALEFCVALMLVGLGLRSLLRRNIDEGTTALRPLLVGAMHGLAGSAVLALLLIGSTGSAASAVVYLLCFCVGTVAGMAAISVLFALPARIGAAPSLRLSRALRVSAAVASLAIGLVMAHRVGLREGLFAATILAP